jgi:hypothetical protein
LCEEEIRRSRLGTRWRPGEEQRSSAKLKAGTAAGRGRKESGRTNSAVDMYRAAGHALAQIEILKSITS